MLVLTFEVGKERLALDVRRIEEVVPWVRLQPVACGPSWLAGIFIYRGQIVPVIDMHRLLGAGECPVHLSTRIILVRHLLGGQDRLVGLLAAKVAAPILLTALIVGFAISLFQAATQIQEPTLSFVPKMIAVAIALLVTGNWTLSELVSFTHSLFDMLPHLLGRT